MNNSNLKKYGASVLLGWACFLMSYVPIPIDSAYDLYLLPGFLLLAVVALHWGMKCAVICGTLGLAMFSPFLVVPTNGWGNLITAVFILFWAAGLGLCRDLITRKKFPFFTIYLFQALFVVVYFLSNKTLIQFAAQYNPPFWYKNYAFSYLPQNLINASATILAETLTICVLLTNSMLALPVVKRFLRRKTNGYEKSSYFVVGITGLLAVVFTTFSPNGMNNGMMSISFTINVYQSSIGNMQLALLKVALILLLGDFAIHYLEYYNGQEQKKRELAETQKAVFESSDDMIWCIDGINGKILTYNSVAKAFFDAKPGGFDGQNFYTLFSDEDVVLWNDYFEETVKAGHHQVEYYDSLSEHYFRVQLHCIHLNDKIYDIAVFAKDITDEIMLEDQTKRMNEELEIKVLERTQELRSAYQEMENMCYMIAHEFKSPIRAISLYNEIVTEEASTQFTQEAEEASQKIAMYCNKALDMIREILQYSKMKSSRLTLVRVNMNKLVEDTIQELRMIYHTQEIRMTAIRLPNVMGDEILLRCCVYNILSNSVKYSSKSSFTEIHVLYEDTKDETIFRFKDNGAGFDMEYAKDLFQMFNRMHLDTEFHGNGIGLATVKNIIEKHGGKVNIEAKVNAGCTVSFSIPK